MSCSNCFNGCTEIISDKCVRYSGENIESLTISKGDPISEVLPKISAKVAEFLVGEGFEITIDTNALCDLLTKNLNPGANDLISILSSVSKGICELSTLVEEQSTALESIFINYSAPCLGLPSGSTFGAMIQAMLNKICTFDNVLKTLLLEMESNYVKTSEIDDYIDEYITSNPSSTLMSAKMIPYVAVEYYGPLDYFSASGAGQGVWDRIFLCNGNNGTPDKRGRIPVGAIIQTGGPVLPNETNPAITGNPNYSLLSTAGSNLVTLNANQIPAHSHEATASFSADPHSHFVAVDGARTTLTANNTIDTFSDSNDNSEYQLSGTTGTADKGKTSPITVEGEVTVEVSETGGNQSHSNIPPVLACYYIIYLP